MLLQPLCSEAFAEQQENKNGNMKHKQGPAITMTLKQQWWKSQRDFDGKLAFYIF